MYPHGKERFPSTHLIFILFARGLVKISVVHEIILFDGNKIIICEKCTSYNIESFTYIINTMPNMFIPISRSTCFWHLFLVKFSKLTTSEPHFVINSTRRRVYFE